MHLSTTNSKNIFEIILNKLEQNEKLLLSIKNYKKNINSSTRLKENKRFYSSIPDPHLWIFISSLFQPKIKNKFLIYLIFRIKDKKYGIN